jgi:hypothetical protein
MKIDLTKRIKTLKGDFLIKSSANSNELIEKYADEEGQVDINELPKEYHQTYGDTIELALVQYSPKGKAEASHAQVLASKTIGSDSADLNANLRGSLVNVLEDVTYKQSAIKWWATTPIISELEGVNDSEDTKQ